MIIKRAHLRVIRAVAGREALALRLIRPGDELPPAPLSIERWARAPAEAAEAALGVLRRVVPQQLGALELDGGYLHWRHGPHHIRVDGAVHYLGVSVPMPAPPAGPAGGLALGAVVAQWIAVCLGECAITRPGLVPARWSTHGDIAVVYEAGPDGDWQGGRLVLVAGDERYCAASGQPTASAAAPGWLIGSSSTLLRHEAVSEALRRGAPPPGWTRGRLERVAGLTSLDPWRRLTRLGGDPRLSAQRAAELRWVPTIDAPSTTPVGTTDAFGRVGQRGPRGRMPMRVAVALWGRGHSVRRLSRLASEHAVPVSRSALGRLVARSATQFPGAERVAVRRLVEEVCA